ncbi:MAG: hypothetical protein IJ167_03575, partial [Lachnospiraceae bacterium]|nr:hypothetical protein [Lachnospiraceae bacterium]
MKKLELSVTRESGCDAIRYELLGNEEYDERIADKINQMVNVIPFVYDNVDGKRLVTTFVSDSNYSLESFLNGGTLKKQAVLRLLSELISIFDLGAKGIPVSYVVKDFNYIYLYDKNAGGEKVFGVKCILIPVKQDAISLSEIPEFFRNVLSRISYDDADTDNYVAKLITVINTVDFSTNKLKNYIDDELEKMGIDISKEKMNGTDNGDNSGQNKSVKVNRIGVINNMQSAQPYMSQSAMGQPGMMGQQPHQSFNQPPMGQPGMMGQPGRPPMMGGQPNSGMRPMGHPGVPPMGQP